MISNSKILTVSYGTFSCTLEGFDDSFGTMKAIAEYFRDLAADDRYFGAEPPTPDADMLARIAEREIARRVEAREDGGKIVLSAQQPTSSDTAQAAPEYAAPQNAGPEHAEPKRLDAADAPMTQAMSPPPEPDQATDDAPVSNVTEMADDARATPPADEEPSEPAAPVRTAPLTAPQPAPRPAASPPQSATEEVGSTPASAIDTHAARESAAEDAPARGTSPLTAPMPTATPDASPNTEVQPQEDGPEIRTEAAEAKSEVEPAEEGETQAPAEIAATEPEEVPAEEVVPEGDTESVAAKLRRIRSVVARSGEDYGFDDEADDGAATFLQNAADELDAALAMDDAAEPARPDSDGIAAAPDTGPDEMPPQPDAAEMPNTASELDDTLAQLLADAMPEGTSNADEAARTSPASAPQARVFKVKRDELQEAITEGRIEQQSGTDKGENLFSEEDTIGGPDPAESGLSAEEEAELQRELAEVEAELGDTTADAGADAEDTDEDDNGLDALIGRVSQGAPQHPAPDPEPQEQPRTETSQAAGQDEAESGGAAERDSEVSRIFDKTATQRDEPDTSKRRNAIQHLRAAVAATRAEKKAGGDIAREVDDTPYRSDLANVVRPRRPSADGAPRSERPTGEQAAPLKLVAEQRVDNQQRPVQPRRVTPSDAETDASITEGSGSFAAFVEEVGAGSLAEMLEAAAAYMSDVEGRPKFSRPMLMGKLKEVEGEGFTREDGLRSFGQLLRQGKLQKLNGGHFSITEETDFRAPQRNVG